jgi:hypothetical protein
MQFSHSFGREEGVSLLDVICLKSSREAYIAEQTGIRREREVREIT